MNEESRRFPLPDTMEQFVIRLDNLKFYSRIGVLEQERTVGNEFSVDIRINIDADGFIPEDLTTSISYADIYDIVAEEMRGEWLLLESAAKEISERLKAKWSKITGLSVKITKLSAPITGIEGLCSVEYQS